MISDVLSEAVQGIDAYLNSPVFRHVYVGEMRARIIEERGRMDALRRELDTPPRSELASLQEPEEKP